MDFWLAEQQVKITGRKGCEIGLNIDWMPALILRSLSYIFPGASVAETFSNSFASLCRQLAGSLTTYLIKL